MHFYAIFALNSTLNLMTSFPSNTGSGIYTVFFSYFSSEKPRKLETVRNRELLEQDTLD